MPADEQAEAEEVEQAILAERAQPHRIDTLPTPTEIATACACIQSGWTLSEKTRRRVGGADPSSANPWQPPVIDMSVYGQVKQGVSETA